MDFGTGLLFGESQLCERPAKGVCIEALNDDSYALEEITSLFLFSGVRGGASTHIFEKLVN